VGAALEKAGAPLLGGRHARRFRTTVLKSSWEMSGDWGGSDSDELDDWEGE
jgi:hypothetical protein